MYLRCQSFFTKMNRRVAIFVFFVLLSENYAHTLGEGYVFLKNGAQGITGRIELTLSDLNDAIGLDQNTDGKISDEELTSKLDKVKSYITERLKFAANDTPLPYRYTTHKIMKVSSAKFLMLDFVIENLQSSPDVLDIDYSLLFEIDPLQRGLLVVEENYRTGTINKEEKVSLIFSPKRQFQKLDLTTSSPFKEFLVFVGQGVWHILIGLDHILFILALILISVVSRKERIWEPVPTFHRAFINLIKIVTLFTIAHSITLCLAALEIVQLSPRMVESVIAASVVVAASNNLIPIFAGRDWLIIFCFGLFHGLGFASVLGHLTFSQQSLVIVLFGFNVGVEIGQLGIVCISFPILFALRKKNFYSPVFIKLGSIIIGIIALKWFIERAFQLG